MRKIVNLNTKRFSEKSHGPQDMLPLSADILHLSHLRRSLTVWSSQFYYQGLQHHGPHTCSAAEATDMLDPLAKLWVMT